MAIIKDPDKLVRAASLVTLGDVSLKSNVFVDTSTKEITLAPYIEQVTSSAAVTFTAPSTITWAGFTTALFAAGDIIKITGASNGANNDEFYISTVNDGVSVVVTSALIETEGVGTVTIEQKNDGVNLQTLYSFLKEEWDTDDALINFKFPMLTITEEQFELIYGWDFSTADTEATKLLIRDGGWALKDTASNSLEEWPNVTTLGSFDDAEVDTAYYIQDAADTAGTAMVLTGPVNQAIKVYNWNKIGSATDLTFNGTENSITTAGNVDFSGLNAGDKLVIRGAATAENNNTFTVDDGTAAPTSTKVYVLETTILDEGTADASATFWDNTTIVDERDFFVIFLREQGKTYASYDLLTEQNLTALTYKKYAMPLSNGTDLKITASDGIISGANDPYQNMSITWFGTPESRQINTSGPYDFSIVIDGASGTAEQIYEFVQWSLRRAADIDDGAGTEYGELTDELLEFVGDTLYTKFADGKGVYIDNFLPADTNRIKFTDDANTEQAFPYVAAGQFLFNDNLQNANDAIFRTFFTHCRNVDDDTPFENAGNDFDTANAIIVNKSTGINITTADVSFTNATQIINVGTGDLTDLAVGDSIVISGAAQSGNNGMFLVAGKAGQNITIQDKVPATTGTDIRAIVDETTGASVTINSLKMTGYINNQSSYSWDYDFDNNIQRGASSNDNASNKKAPITVVAIGTESAQYVIATGTILESVQNSITLVSNLERNYLNA